MKALLLILPFTWWITSFTMTDQTVTLVHFSKDTELNTWRIQDDVVMGGRSSGRFELTDEGKGHFFGHVSLENNGGFSSVRHRMAEPRAYSEQAAFILRVKGDGKQYQFRVKSSPGQRYSHIGEFTTSGTGEWETIVVPFANMYPAFRGRKLDLPNYAGGPVTEIAFLIGNKKEQDFSLEIDAVMAR